MDDMDITVTPAEKSAEFYLPDFDYIEKAGNVGPGFGPPITLGPAGELARSIRDNDNSLADKALYFYLYKTHPWVYACVELICQTAAQDRHTYPTEDMPHGSSALQQSGRATKASAKAQKRPNLGRRDLREDDGDEADLGPEPKDGVEFLEHFFAEVNDFEGFNDLLEATYRDLMISGEAFILKQRLGARVLQGKMSPTEGEEASAGIGRYSHVVQNAQARVVSLHRIPSRYTRAIAGDGGYPEKFRQYADGGGFREYALADVIYFRIPDPTNPGRGLSPLESLDLSLATDVSAGKYNEAFFRNGAKAGMVFSAQGLSEPEIRRNKEWIKNEYVRPENAHKPMLLLGNITLVRDGNKAQNDMEFINLRAFTREDICAVYSVPISKLLMQDGSSGQTGKMSDDITFRADTVGPLQTKVYEAVNRQLMKRDFPAQPLLVPPRQEKIRLDLLEAAQSLVSVGGTGNEARAVLHLPTMDDDPMMNKPLFFTPGLRTLTPDDPTPGLDQQKFAKTGSAGGGTDGKSDAKRPDRRSVRTRNGKTNAKVKSGRGMKRISKAQLLELIDILANDEIE